MKFSELKMRVIAPLMVLCCLVGIGSQVAKAQTSPKFQTGDVFAGVGNGQINWYRLSGSSFTLVKTLSVGTTSTYDTGMAFDAAGNLYSTNFSVPSVSKFDTSGTLLGTFGSGYNASPESILFDSTGNVYVGQADGSHQVRKFDSGGNFLAVFSPATEFRGTDWIELAGDQRTIYYTSEGTSIKRFDVGANTQLTDFATGLPGGAAFALRILSNGNVLVANSDRALQLDTSGNIIHTYQPPGSPKNLFSLNLDPDGTHFWVGDISTGTIWQIRIADAGTVVDQTISTGVVPSGFTGLFGVVVFGEITQSKQSVSLHFPPGAASTQTATFLSNNSPTDPASHAMAFTTNVTNPNGIDLVVTAHDEPTELTHDPTNGVGLADGICEVSQLGGVLANVDETKDFDCRLAKGGFVYQTLSNGDVVVPHCSPYHNNMCVWYSAATSAKAADEVPPGSPICSSTVGPPCYDYVGPVYEKIGWNTNVILAPSSTEYAPGWNNQNARLYDRRGDDPDIAFKFDITTFYDVNGSVSAVLAGDQTGGGTTKHFNDWVFADVPNPPTGTAPDTVEPLVPVPGISPFTYLRGQPMLVAFELEHGSTEMSDPTALTMPHSVNIATRDANGVTVPVQFPVGFPTTFTYSPFFKAYFIFLSSAPYKLSDGTANTVYTLQIGSDLFTQPVNAKFKVCTLSQVLGHTCP
jgi:hypothetical protein